MSAGKEVKRRGKKVEGGSNYFRAALPGKGKNLFIGLRPLRLSEGIRFFYPPFPCPPTQRRKRGGGEKIIKPTFLLYDNARKFEQ